jgi:hypothetical protein
MNERANRLSRTGKFNQPFRTFADGLPLATSGQRSRAWHLSSSRALTDRHPSPGWITLFFLEQRRMRERNLVRPRQMTLPVGVLESEGLDDFRRGCVARLDKLAASLNLDDVTRRCQDVDANGARRVAFDCGWRGYPLAEAGRRYQRGESPGGSQIGETQESLRRWIR